MITQQHCKSNIKACGVKNNDFFYKVFSFYINIKKNINIHIKFAHSNKRNFKFEKQALEVTIEYVIFLNLTKPKILAEYIQKQAHTY